MAAVGREGAVATVRAAGSPPRRLCAEGERSRTVASSWRRDATQWWHGVHLQALQQRMKMELAAGIMGATGVAGLPKLDEKGGSSAGTEEGVHVLSISAHLQLADFYLKAELPTNGSQDRKLSLISQCAGAHKIFFFCITVLGIFRCGAYASKILTGQRL
ncbi:hypothetical protein TRIUR3_03370 [Triticum urartu]|uniref:Uncharacterized protein n=1 Tax=Triticum urartu TaxID=4572 RepID=M7ZPN7_TRIUA|nr:hypothetical protein TRIUR3_03370 [Triticum urartu]